MPHLSRHAPQRLDADTPDPLVRPDTARELLNVRVSPEGRVVVSGTVPVTGGPLADESVVVGQDYDHETGYAYALRYHADGAHSLWQTDPVSNTETLVLQWAGLNPPAPGARHADGLPRVADVQAFDGRVFFLDADGETRYVEVARALAGEFSAPLLAAEPTTLHLLPAPPTHAPQPTGYADLSAPQRLTAWAYQWATRYRYTDGRVSALSPYSRVIEVDQWVASPKSPTEETALKEIAVYIPGPHPSDVVEIELLVREGVTPTWAVAATLRREAGEWPARLSRRAWGGTEAVAVSETTKPFDALWPARALGLGQNRLLAAGTTAGYLLPDVPLTVYAVRAAQLVLENVDGPTFARLQAPVLATYSGNYPSTNPIAGALVGGLPGADDAVYAEVGLDRLDDNGETLPYINERNAYHADALFSPPDLLAGAVASSGVVGIDPALAFVEDASYEVAVVFFDRLGRHAGATAPVRVSTGVNGVGYYDTDWILHYRLPELGDADLAASIPAWATHYQLVVSENDKYALFTAGALADILGNFGTSSDVYNGVQARLAEWIYAKWNDNHWRSDPDFQRLISIYLDISFWPEVGLGYVWQPGDFVRVTGTLAGKLGKADFEILSQQGGFLEIGVSLGPQSANLGEFDGPWGDELWNVTEARSIIEIYRPRTAAPADAGLLREATPVYRILDSVDDDGNAVRSYESPQGYLRGDCLVRQLYFPYVTHDGTARKLVVPGALRTVLAPYTPAVGTWLQATRGRATAHLPPVLQRVERTGAVTFSAPRVAGTRYNGLGSWDALNEKEVPRELGAIVGLRVVDDEVQATGSVLGVIAANGSGSFYLGRVQLRDTGATTLNVEAEQVLGSFNSWRGGFGCRHPHTIHGAYGRLYWYCEPKDELVRYAQNGVTPLALTYRYRTVLRAYGEALRAPGASAAHGGAGGYDGFALESLTLLPAVTDEESGTVTPALLLAFSDRQEGFVGPYSFVPEALVGLPGGLLSATAGQLHRHHQGAPATFYGVAYPAVCRFVAPTSQAATPVLWQALVVESNGPWLPTRLSNERGQVSQVLRGWLKPDRDLWTCALRGDAGPTNSTARLLHGPRLRSLTLDVTLTLAPDEMSAADRLDTISVKGAFDTTPLAY